ncbi:hypothetical protein HMPREF1017_03632 [Bacteroides ovatus 3_8_47FAA]|uniref:hypothetical protein n=1 Tax=Bacteroides ovatus TaxID=28116 RepID=UPI00021324B7|nr:hypothetical protein [Bacteroides ovatus]EGN00798.1 hypothetical protein HMPREF1017_03632 [Bacteroides ovatus 3_8_47FAA]QGT70013.1 hypothetical protein FOC41_03065 [Bacteroides ovatus]
MTNKMVIGYKFAFILLLLSSCVEDIRNCDIGNVDNMIPDGKERMELRLIIPGGKQPVVRSVENGTTDENKIERLFMDVMNSGTVIASRSTADGALTLTPTDVDSVYTVSTLFDIGTLEAGYTLRVRANEDTPAIISRQPVSLFYMSGTGVIKEGISRNFKASAHLLRGVAKLRTTVRKTSSTVPQELIIGDVKVQVIHVADKIRKYAPFSSHANEAVIENLPVSSLNYLDFPEVSLTDIALQELGELDGEAATFYSHYIYENYLEQESDYDPATNVTSVKLTIPVTDGITSRVIERTIPVKTEKSFRIKRNHIYSIDVQVLSLDEVKIFTDVLDWEDVGVTGDIVGTDFDIDRSASKGITLIKDIADPVKLVKVDCHAPGRLQIRALKSNKTDLISTTDLQLYCNGIAETDKLADNSGIYDLTAAQVMNFYCTTGSVPANYEGGFIEISSDNVHVVYIPIGSLDTFIPLDTEGTANSYIADRGAASYSFTATIMGNGADGIIDEGKFEDASGNILTKAGGANIHPLSAKLLWQDTDELVEQVALVNGRVQVKMGRSRGNALIAVYDKANPNAEDAKVLWSWHLWCTPVPQIIEYTAPRTGHEYTIMDRNVGATTSTLGLVTTQGLQYQFGRKDPFTTSLDYDEDVAVFLRNVRSDSLPHLFSYEEPLTIAQAIGKPDVFIHRMNLSGGKWCETSEMKYLWGNPEGQAEYFPSLTVKTIYDPCPIGYKVPPVDALMLQMKSYSQYEHGGIYYAGEEGDNTKLINMPAVHSAYYAYGTSIAYWTSSDFGKPNSTFEWGEFGFMHTYYPGSHTLRYNAFARPGSIRCVKE